MDNYIFYNGSRIKNLQGQRFGKLTANKAVEIKNRYAIWECKCDCGNIRNVSAKLLNSGTVKMCSDCARKEKSIALMEKHANTKNLNKEDLTGRSFEDWKVIKKGVCQNGVQMWECKCLKCGSVREFPVYKLVNNTIAKCKCQSPAYRLLNSKMGLLTVVGVINGKCKCKCKCGKEIIVSVSDLCWRRSCGCMDDIEKTEHTKLALAVNKGQKIRKDNTSGVSGVHRVNGKWGARITFQKKTYWLGTYGKKKDAIEARKKAEEHLYTDFMDWYNTKYSKSAETINEKEAALKELLQMTHEGTITDYEKELASHREEKYSK